MHSIRHTSKRALTLVAALTTGLLLAACAAEDPDAITEPESETDDAAELPPVEQNDELRSRLPDEILNAEKIISVNSGSFPPYTIVGSDESSNTGASTDLLNALGELWGVEVEEQTVDGLSSILTGISADRYDMGFGPIGDFKERQENIDFVDFVQEFVVFAVEAGNPESITDLESTCGKKVSVQAGGSAEKVIKEQSDACTEAGEDAIEVMSFKDQPQSILAVQSGRAHAFFSSQAPLTYFVEESGGALELAGTGQANGFDTLYQGAVVEKDSDLGPLLQDSLQELFDNGVYEAIMNKWNLADNMIDETGMNMAVS